jgi:hypothetical protein
MKNWEKSPAPGSRSLKMGRRLEFVKRLEKV